MTDTPETDAAQIFLGLNPDEGDYFVPAEIARKLEQQRNEAVNNYETAVLREHRMEEQRDWYKAACDKYSEVETVNTLCSLKEQRDQLVDVAEKLIAMIRVNYMHGMFTDCSIEKIDHHLRPWINKIETIKGTKI
jgi:hypothetical protein